MPSVSHYKRRFNNARTLRLKLKAVRDAVLNLKEEDSFKFIDWFVYDYEPNPHKPLKRVKSRKEY